MTHVFISGCYDILHAGHIQFFREAKALGDHLTICFASEDVLWNHKLRKPSIPDEHKKGLLEALEIIDEVVIGNGKEMGLDFKDAFLERKPDILAVTEDDQYGDLKRKLCEQVGAQYTILPKTPPLFTPVSTTELVNRIRAPHRAPLRVDFAGGWLDVPRHAREGGHVVNCAISPLVSLNDWSYEQNSGLGGSGAWAIINTNSGVKSEISMGVGWQDPAVISETGLCLWESGPTPKLVMKRNGDILKDRMAIVWTGKPHDTPGLADHPRDYDAIFAAGEKAREAVEKNCLGTLIEATNLSYAMQLDEGMDPLPHADQADACKYCGGGFGGYALAMFQDPARREAFLSSTPEARAIQPYIRTF